MTSASSHTPSIAPTAERLPSSDWLRDAAIALGAAPAVAEEFAGTGCLQLNDTALLVQPRMELPGEWLAMARVPAPASASVGSARWVDALLTANGQMMPITHCAFVLDDAGAAVPVQRIPRSHCRDALLLSADLYGLASIAGALVQGLQQAAPPKPAAMARAATKDSAVTPAARQAMEAAAAEMAARPLFPPALHSLLREAVACHGGGAAALLAHGATSVRGHRVGIASNPAGETLVLACELGKAAFATLEHRRAALRANLELLGSASVAVGCLSGQPTLLGRWDPQGQAGTDLALWMDDFVDASQAIGRPQGSGVPSPATRTGRTSARPHRAGQTPGRPHQGFVSSGGQRPRIRCIS